MLIMIGVSPWTCQSLRGCQLRSCRRRQTEETTFSVSFLRHNRTISSCLQHFPPSPRPTTVTPRLRTHEKNTPEPRLTYETTLFLHKLYALNHMSEKLAHNFKFSFFGLLVMQCRSWGHCWVWHAPGGIWYCVYSAFLDRL